MTNGKKWQLRAVAAFTVVVLSTGCGRTPPPTTPIPQPTPYEQASLTRGGRLYDNWMKEKRVTAPAAANPSYALTQGKSTSITATWRCNECHGWDYRGVDGMYSKGSHFTAVEGLLHAKEHDAPEELFEVIMNGKKGEAMTAFSTQGHTEADVWDLVKFIKEGVVDLTGKFDDEGKPLGADPVAGKVLYEQGLPDSDPLQSCASCHGADGKKINFHAAPQEPEYLGSVSDSPAQFTHHVRFGYAGGLTMPAFRDRGWSLENVLDVLAYVQTLPTH